MTAVELTNHTLLFAPDLDLEQAPELPGKHVMDDALRRVAESEAPRPKLINADHGWCFQVRGDDSRRYELYLSYVATEGGTSTWMLCCNRCPGMRFWEWFRERENVGREAVYLGKVADILVKLHAFVQTA